MYHPCQAVHNYRLILLCWKLGSCSTCSYFRQRGRWSSDDLWPDPPKAVGVSRVLMVRSYKCEESYQSAKDQPVYCYIVLQSLCDWRKILGLVHGCFHRQKYFCPGTLKSRQPWEGGTDLCTKVPAPPPFTTEPCGAQQTFMHYGCGLTKITWH